MQGGKKGSKNQQWGPILPVRRNNRFSDNGKSVTETAQDIKRKWNLEANAEIQLEEYGSPVLYVDWDTTKLSGSMPGRQKGDVEALLGETQGYCKIGPMAPRECKLKRCHELEEFLTTPGATSSRIKLVSSPTELPWWRELNATLADM